MEIDKEIQEQSLILSCVAICVPTRVYHVALLPHRSPVSPGFDPKVGLLSMWSFTCFPHIHVCFPGFLVSPHLPKTFH